MTTTNAPAQASQAITVAAPANLVPAAPSKPLGPPTRAEAAYSLFVRYVFLIDVVKDVMTLPQVAAPAALEAIASVLKHKANGDPDLVRLGRDTFVDKLAAAGFASAGAIYDASAPRNVHVRELLEADNESRYDPADKISAIALGQTIRELGIDDVAYIFALEKFIAKKKDGTYDIEKLVSGESAVKHLVAFNGYDVGTAAAVVKGVIHRTVYSLETEPEKPPIFFDTDGKEMLNLYSQPTIPSVPGSWSRIFLVLCVLTGGMLGDMDGARWLFNWMAALVQRPGRRGMVTPCFIGPQGCGKTALGKFIARILGLANCAEISGKSLRDDFNSQFVTKLFVVANEIILPTGDRLEILETMKTYLTDELVDLKTPHARRIQVKNRMSFWLTSNGTNPVRVEDDDDRRNTVFNIPKSVMTAEYRAHLKSLFDPVTQEPTEETTRELEALAHDLRSWDVDWDLAVTPLKNEARTRQIEMSKGSFQQFAEIVEDDRNELGRLIQAVINASDDAERAELMPYAFAEGLSVEIVFAAYQRYSKRHGGTPLGQPRFCGEWGRFFEEKYPKKKRGAEPRKPVFVGLVLPDDAFLNQTVVNALAQATDDQLRAELSRRRRSPDNPELSGGAPSGTGP